MAICASLLVAHQQVAVVLKTESEVAVALTTESKPGNYTLACALDKGSL